MHTNCQLSKLTTFEEFCNSIPSQCKRIRRRNRINSKYNIFLLSLCDLALYLIRTSIQIACFAKINETLFSPPQHTLLHQIFKCNRLRYQARLLNSVFNFFVMVKCSINCSFICMYRGNARYISANLHRPQTANPYCRCHIMCLHLHSPKHAVICIQHKQLPLPGCLSALSGCIFILKITEVADQSPPHSPGPLSVLHPS